MPLHRHLTKGNRKLVLVMMKPMTMNGRRIKGQTVEAEHCLESLQIFLKTVIKDQILMRSALILLRSRFLGIKL